MLPSHEEHISSLFKFEQFLNEVKYQHFWDLHWLQRSFWTLELPKECLALSLLPKPIPTYFTGLPSQSWPAWEAWRGVKILADAGRNQLPHCRVTHATALCWQEHRCAGSKPWSGWVIQMSTRAAPEGTYVLGVVHKVVQPLCPWRDDLRGLCYGCPALWLWTTVPCHGKSFHLSAPRESCPPCLTFLLSFSKPRDALITNSRILWFVPKVPEIRADMGGCGGDGIWRLANLKTHFIAYLIPLRGAEVAWILPDLPSLEEEKRLHLLKQIIFETNFNTSLLTLELKGSCYRIRSSIGVWVTVILLNTGANLLLCTAKKDVRLSDAVPDPNMHPTTSLSPHCYVPDPHCASPGS